MPPSLAGFVWFVRNIMGISTTFLPDGSVYFNWAYNVAVELVNQALCAVGTPGADPTMPSLYARAVYNLAGDTLINVAQDQSRQTYFTDARTKFNIFGYVSGVIQSTSDETTAESMVVPDWVRELTMSQLQNLKTPWGRAYIGIAQSYGPTIWGLT